MRGERILLTVQDIRKEMDRLDKLSDFDTRKIPVRISSRMTKTWGKCTYKRVRGSFQITEMVFADRLLRYATEEHILEVVRHEYAHAFVLAKLNKDDGHGRIWQKWAIRFGSNGTRCNSFAEVSDALADQKAKYRVICACCGQVFRYQRKSNIVKALEADPNMRSYQCGRCYGREFLLESNEEN